MSDIKIIIDTLANAVKSGKLTLTDVPEAYRTLVQERLGEGEATASPTP